MTQSRGEALDGLGRFCLGAAATLAGGAVVGVATEAIRPGPWIATVAVLVVGLLSAAGVSYWHERGDNFPQWFFDDDPYGLVIQVAQSADQFIGDEQAEGLHLSAKNRPWRGRKTKAARDAWLHAIFDGGPAGTVFMPQLVWSAGRPWPPPKVIDLLPGDRVYIPIAMKKFPAAKVDSGFMKSLKAGATYLMDEQYHHSNAAAVMELRPTDYNIAVWIEYDGGRKSRRYHFRLKVKKGEGTPNELVVADDV